MKCPECQLENPDSALYCGRCGTSLLSSDSRSFSETGTVEKFLERGETFAQRYEVVEQLGKGGMGSVFRVLDTQINEEVALKLLNPDIAADKVTIDRFTVQRVAAKNAHRVKMKKLAFLILLFLTLAMIPLSSSFYKPGILKETKRLRSSLEPPSQEEVEPSFWRVAEDILLYYFQSGKGQPVLVIHGGPGFPPSQTWTGLEKLRNKYKFYYYHQRGCGKSTRPVDTFDSDNYLQNMVDLTKSLGIVTQIADIERIRRILKREKIILIGHSYGGFLATLYAVEFPEHVEKMVLIAPAGVLKMPIEEGSGLDALKHYLSEEMKSKFDDFVARYFDYGQIFSKSEKALIALNHEFIQFFEAAYKKSGLTIPDQAGKKPDDIGGWMAHAMYFSLGLKYDLRNELKKINAPVLVIHGMRDVMPSKVSQEYADLFPKGQLANIPQATHFPYLETPEKFAELVGDFLSKL